jgi:hypothetical protein
VVAASVAGISDTVSCSPLATTVRETPSSAMEPFSTM